MVFSAARVLRFSVSRAKAVTASLWAGAEHRASSLSLRSQWAMNVAARWRSQSSETPPRRRGRSSCCKRLLGQIPQGHYLTATLIAGMGCGGSSAPWIFEGAMDGEMFLAWVRLGLAPTLLRGQTVILDNLATHKASGVREAIEAVGACLEFLPPYSPDLNPIENMWSQVK